MSFDLMLLRFAAGDLVRIDAGALRDALARHGIRGAGSEEYVETRDGQPFELRTTRKASHDELALSMRGISGGMFELIHELAHACRLTVVVSDSDAPVIVAAPDLVRELPEPYLERALVCASPEALASALLPVFERWRDWVL